MIDRELEDLSAEIRDELKKITRLLKISCLVQIAAVESNVPTRLIAKFTDAVSEIE